MLLQRSITAFILLVLVGLVFIIDNKLLFVLSSSLFFGIAMFESLKMLKINQINTIGMFGIFVITSIYLSYTTPPLQLYIQILISILWIFIIPIIVIFNMNIHRFLLIPIVFLILLIGVYNMNLFHEALGNKYLLSIMAISWISDIGAYFVGKKFGRHKLAIKISPNKTIEGAIGGLVFVIIYLFILRGFAFYVSSYMNAINIAIILVSYSILGDLFESHLKRVANVKDSSNILPGHGGVFDRIDSLIAVLAIANLLIM